MLLLKETIIYSLKNMFIHSPIMEATLLAVVFDCKQSNEKLYIPLSCFLESKLHSFTFQPSEVKKCLLDSFGAVDSNGNFSFLKIKTACFMTPNVSVVFHKLARMGSFASCWRYSNVTPLSKMGVLAQFLVNANQFQLFLFCLKFLSTFWLSVFMHLLKLMIIFPV